MKFTATLTLAVALALTACGGSDSELRSDPDVKAILEGYEELGATDAEVDQLAKDIDAALDVYDTEAERRDYLRELRTGLEESIEGIEEFRESEGVDP